MRRRLLQWHRWTGLTAGLLFIVVAITGAGMAFRPQLEPLLLRGLVRVPACAAPLALDVLVDAARKASPASGPLAAIRLAGDAETSARVRFSDSRWIFVDPCGGRVLGSQAVYGGPFGLLARVHIFGYLPFGELLAGSLALLLSVVMAVGGMALWWPNSVRLLRDSWRLKPGLRGRAFQLKLHKTVALYAAPVLLACALTGLPQAFGWAKQAIEMIGGDARQPLPPAAPIHSRPTASVSLEALWRQAQTLSPQPRKLQVRAPRSSGEPIVLEIVARDAPHANAISYFHFDAATGALLRHTPHAANPTGHRLYLWMLALHYGWIGGVAGQLILLLGALAVPLLAWTGTASYLRGRAHGRQPARQRLLVLRKTVEAVGICSFELAAPRGKRLPPFSAGAHIDVHTPGGAVRQYSLCNDPRETQRYRIAVLRCEDTRGGSRAMHDMLREGDTIETGLPRNHFPLAPDARHSILLAGGIGITPILSMAEQLAADGAGFELHYCCRDEPRAAFRETLGGARFAGRVHFHYSEGQPPSRLDLDALLALPAAGTHVYVCGPAAFMDAVSATAARHAWPEAQVHREHFAGAADTAPGQPFDIRLASSGRVIQVPAGVSALAALANSGVAVRSSCGQGVCGSCVTGVLEGEPEHRDQCLTAEEKARNDRFTPCCSRARTALLVLDL